MDARFDAAAWEYCGRQSTVRYTLGMVNIDGPSGPYEADVRWSYQSRRGPEFREVALWYGWEVNFETFSDDYLAEEISAAELWDLYWRRYGDRILSEDGGVGVVSIAWFVYANGPTHSTMEGAPLLHEPPEEDQEDFLTHFTMPVMEGSGERINWLRLPVTDYVWRADRSDKGGWFQEITGWKPNVLQTSVDLRKLARLAGLPIPQ